MTLMESETELSLALQHLWFSLAGPEASWSSLALVSTSEAVSCKGLAKKFARMAAREAQNHPLVISLERDTISLVHDDLGEAKAPFRLGEELDESLLALRDSGAWAHHKKGGYDLLSLGGLSHKRYAALVAGFSLLDFDKFDKIRPSHIFFSIPCPLSETRSISLIRAVDAGVLVSRLGVSKVSSIQQMLSMLARPWLGTILI